MGWWGKRAKDKRIQIAFLSAGGFAIVVGLYEGVIITLTGERSTALKIAYLFEAIWEAAFFGFGLGFFVVYGNALRKMDSGPVRSRCIAIWLSISYFFMSWWPHASVHQFLTPLDPTGFIILEMCFHWPNLVAALVLCYYQLDVLLISFEVAANNKELRGWTEADKLPVPWYKNLKFHGLLISIFFTPFWITFGWYYNPFPPFITPWQKALFITIFITDGMASGLAFGFVYSAARLVHRLPKPRTRFIAGISMAAVAYILIIATPHYAAHNAVARNPNQVIVVEYLFHLSITGAVSVLAYYQHRFLVLSLKGRMNMMMKFKDKQMEDNLTSDTEIKLSQTNSSASMVGTSSGVQDDA